MNNLQTPAVFKRHAIKISFEASFKLERLSFLDSCLSLFNRYRDLFARGLTVTNMQNLAERPCFEPHDVQTTARMIDELRDESGDLIILSTEEKRIGDYVDDPKRKAELTFGILETHSAPFKFHVCLTLFRPGVQEISLRTLENLFIDMAMKLRAYYGYGHVMSLPIDSVYGQSAGMGPDRLEWLNWFGDCYEDVFDINVLTRCSTQKLSEGGRCYYYMKLCDNPNDYNRLAVRLRIHAQMKALGRECFSRRLEGPLSMFMPRRDASRIPEYKSF